MKILVCSDSHEILAFLRAAVAKEQPEAVLHLGDYADDVEPIRAQWPGLAVWSVRGNCDYASAAPARQELVLGGVRIFLAHGHLYEVKYGLDGFANAAMCAGAQLALFGHTHAPGWEERQGLMLLNPGSIGYGGTYAVVNAENGTFRFSLERISRD